MSLMRNSGSIVSALAVVLAVAGCGGSAGSEDAVTTEVLHSFKRGDMTVTVTRAVEADGGEVLILERAFPLTQGDPLRAVEESAGSLTLMEKVQLLAAEGTVIHPALQQDHARVAAKGKRSGSSLGELRALLDKAEKAPVAPADVSCGNYFRDHVFPPGRVFEQQVGTINLNNRNEAWVCAGNNPVQVGTAPFQASFCTQTFANQAFRGGLCNPPEASASIRADFGRTREGGTTTTFTTPFNLSVGHTLAYEVSTSAAYSFVARGRKDASVTSAFSLRTGLEAD